jgi:thiamine thiazole synthase
MDFAKGITEGDVSRAIINGFTEDLLAHTSTDVIIVGSGPAGLTAGKFLGDAGVKTLLIERNIYAGGGFWQGGFLFPKTVVEAPAHEILEEMGVELEEVKEGLYMADSFRIVARLLDEVASAGAKLLNSTYVDDLIIKEGKVGGVLVNWFPITQMPKFITCMDPIALESQVVIDATGHEAAMAGRAAKVLGFEIKGHGHLNVEEAEREVVKNTKEIAPGLVVCGMASASVFGTPRMGPIFGGMLLSGKRAAEAALEILKKKPLPPERSG